jgi:hypothetical protein
MFNLEATISKIESQIPEPDDRLLFLARLKERLAAMQRAEAAQLENAQQKNNPEDPDLTGTNFPPQQVRIGTQLGRGGTEPPIQQIATGTDAGQTEPVSPPTDSDWDAIEAKLAALPEDLRDVAVHLQEKVHHRSPFARLTATQREAILAMFEDHSGPEMVRVLAEPPPLGMNLNTSKQALSRFKRDHMRYEMNSLREAQRLASEQSRQADEEAFAQSIASDRAFCETTERNIRRRLFEATRNPSAHYQEIRWLITSLAILRKQYAPDESTTSPREPMAPT